MEVARKNPSAHEVVRKITTGEMRDNLSDIVNEAAFGHKRIVLTRHNKEIAAVIPIADLELLNEIERMIDVEEARKVLKELDEGEKTMSLGEFKKGLEGKNSG